MCCETSDLCTRILPSHEALVQLSDVLDRSIVRFPPVENVEYEAEDDDSGVNHDRIVHVRRAGEH